MLAERGFHLDPNRISFVHNSAAAALARAQSFRPDNDEHGVGFRHGIMNMDAEVLAEGNVIDVYKNGILAIPASDPIANAPGKYIRVRATV